MDEQPEPTRTKLPTELDVEQPFLAMAEVKLSLRQMLTMVSAMAVWFLCLKITAWILPISGLFAGLIWSWLIIAGVFFALVQKDGVPYEEYLARKVVFLISDRHYILKGSDTDGPGIEDADWEEAEDTHFSAWGDMR